MMNDKSLVETQLGCITSYSSVGDELCNLSFFTLPDHRARVASTLLSRFVEGTFAQPDLSKTVIQNALEVLEGQLRRPNDNSQLSSEETTTLVAKAKEALQALGKRNVLPR
eukprot:TRINITY_DN226_c0_g1_i2.p1 TRINITY_DN226_c0_g1~~TRINITY_DN226_c0_g1_i2.p1  ORF type:complete len:111 (-),score=24.43 TRINITY_DN226_c0_g1_i2:157-489(-)